MEIRMNEKLEQEIREFVEQEWDGLHDNDGNPLYTADYLEYIARHFAQWGAEHRGSSETPNDLEEAAVEYSAIGYSPFDDPYEKNQQFECSKFAFIAGAKWQMKKDLSSINKSYESGVVFGMNAQKEQMLKDAVEGEVVQDLKGVNRVKSFSKIPEWLHFGDKVKLIIVKED